MPVINVTSADHFIALMSTDKLLVVDGSATWCAPCQMMKPIVEALAEEYADQAVFAVIDVDELPELAEQWDLAANSLGQSINQRFVSPWASHKGLKSGRFRRSF